jgi:hypothetical protein
MPKKGRSKSGKELDPLSLPARLQTALEALYGHYEETFDVWQKGGIEVPPVFIVVCSNTSASKLVYDFISGFERNNDDGSTRLENGRLALFRNYDEHGNRLARPRTLLIDSEQLESGEALDKDFRDMAADEIERFRREIVERTGDILAGEKISDQDLLREVMNTVGKKDRLGESSRCVVSVSMLTEGWDANTVTHILGVRAFGTQLLCEQVVGRALRRQSYDLNEDGRFNVEYADVLGIPFDFAANPVVAPPAKPRETVHVHAVCPDRDALEIIFPRVEGYRVELPDEKLTARFGPRLGARIEPRPGRTVDRRYAGNCRRGRQADGRAPSRHAALDHPVSPRQVSALPEVPRSRRSAEAAPVRPAQGDHPPVAGGRLSALHRRNLSRPAHLSGNRRHGLRADQGGDYRNAGGRTPCEGDPRRLQPDRLHPLRQLHHVEGNALADRSAQVPHKLGRLR